MDETNGPGSPRERPRKQRRVWPATWILGGIVVLSAIAYELHPAWPRLPTGLPASYCDGMAKLRVTFQAASAGTLKHNELVTQLTDEENEIRGAAALMNHSSTRALRFTIALADAVRRFKVAVALSHDRSQATQGLSNAMQIAPSC